MWRGARALAALLCIAAAVAVHSLRSQPAAALHRCVRALHARRQHCSHRIRQQCSHHVLCVVRFAVVLPLLSTAAAEVADPPQQQQQQQHGEEHEDY